MESDSPALGLGQTYSKSQWLSVMQQCALRHSTCMELRVQYTVQKLYSKADMQVYASVKSEHKVSAYVCCS